MLCIMLHIRCWLSQKNFDVLKLPLVLNSLGWLHYYLVSIVPTNLTRLIYAGDNLFSLLFPSRTKSLTAICLSLAWFLASAYYFAYCFFAASWSLTCCNRTSLWPPASTNSSGLVVNFLLKNSSARLTSVVMWFVDLFVPAFPLCIFVYAGLPNLCCQLFLQSSTSLNLLPQSDYLKIQNQSKLPEQYH